MFRREIVREKRVSWTEKIVFKMRQGPLGTVE